MVPDGPNQRFTDFTGPHVAPGGPSSKIGSPDYEKCYAAATGYLVKLFLNRNKQKGTKGKCFVVGVERRGRPAAPLPRCSVTGPSARAAAPSRQGSC